MSKWRSAVAATGGPLPRRLTSDGGIPCACFQEPLLNWLDSFSLRPSAVILAACRWEPRQRLSCDAAITETRAYWVYLPKDKNHFIY